MRAQERRAGQVGKVPLELILSDGSDLSPQGGSCFCGPPGGCEDRYDQGGHPLSEPAESCSGPGCFSRVRAELGIRKGALVIPQRAVSEVQGRYLVAVVSAENKVAIKQVKVGQRFGQLWVIEEGLKAGEKVVAEGTQKVRDGMVVSPKPFGAGGQAEPGAAQKPEAKPEAKTGKRPKPQPKPEKR